MRIPRGREEGERGANLVEFALVAPLIFLLLFGTIEFGWAFAQNLDVKHTAREAGRLAAVNATAAEVEGRVCDNDLLDSANVTSIVRNGGTLRGETATLTVAADWEQLTGLFNWALAVVSPLSSTVEFRLEQDTATGWDGSELAPCP